MSDSPYFQSAGKQIDDSKAALLSAVAQAGTAGKAAFDAAQAQIAQQKQDAVARAAQRSALGVGGNNDTFLSAYDARAGQLGSNQAGFQSGLDQTAASGQSYLEKARSGIGALQAININKGQDAETKIKLAIQAAQAKAAAAAQAQAAQDARANEAANRADARAAKTSAAADARAAATKAAKDPTFNQLVAGGKLEVAASPLNKARLDTGNILGAVTENPDIRMARLAGQDMGYSPLQIGTALNQSATNSYIKGQVPLSTPDEKWLIANVRGMDATKAKQALAAPEMTWAQDFINNTLTAVQVDSTGTITAAPPGFEGMVGQTPTAAFDAWVRAQKGNLTMKDGLSKYYGPAVAAMFGK